MPRTCSLVIPRPAVHTVSSYLDTLASQAHPDGGWGYTPDQVAHLEPTCLALLALSLDGERFRDAIAKGRTVLRRSALPDGSYRLERGREEAVWPTALALFTQSVLGSPVDELRPTA